MEKLRFFIVGGVDGGGSLKFINDFKNAFPTALTLSCVYDLNTNQYTSDDILFIQHLYNTDITHKMICELYLKYDVRIIISIHDFYYLSLEYGTAPQNGYLKSNITINPDITELFSYAELIIHPSEFTYDIFKKYFPKENFIISPHIDLELIDTPLYIPLIKDNTINIGHLTYASECKGLEYISFLHDNFKTYKGYNLKFVVTDLNTPQYYDVDFFKVANTHNIHCMLALNKWGETYCYSLTKYLLTGLPILYNNIGSFRQRITKNDRYFKVFEKEVEFCVDDQELMKKKLSDMLDYIIDNAGTGESSLYKSKSIVVPPLYKFIFKQPLYYMDRPLKEYIHSYIKPFCIYFPQFHKFKENDVNFYEGMTDMSNLIQYIKDGNKEKLDSPNLIQLGIDKLEDYDLSNEKLVRRQVDIAKIYGIYGFCIYYYWFSTNSITGKNSIMESCYNNFFNDEMLDFKVFFTWANEDWTTNSALGGKGDISNKYTQGNIVKNFKNLSKYFKHKNYYKINGCPVFYIHHTWFIKEHELKLISSIFNREAITEGLAGVHIVTNSMEQESTTNTYLFSPNYIKYGSEDYREYTQNLSNTIFFSFNNTARMYKPQNNSIVKIIGTSTDQYISMTKIINSYLRPNIELNKIMLINSWNEWGENMAIEPGNTNGYLYLDMIKDCLLKCITDKILEK